MFLLILDMISHPVLVVGSMLKQSKQLISVASRGCTEHVVGCKCMSHRAHNRSFAFQGERKDCGREQVELSSSETLDMYMSASAGLCQRWHTHECFVHVPHLEVQCMGMLHIQTSKTKLY